MSLSCPECGGDAEHVEESHSIHLYRHRDDFAQCSECGHMWAYRGVALDDAEEGLTFFNVEAGTSATRPTCPEHGRRMVPTKVWPSEASVQFKCEAVEDGETCQRLTTKPLTAD